MRTDELSAIEERGWQALATGPRAATAFYEHILDHAVVILLPGGLVLDDRATILASMAGQSWTSYELSDWRIHQPTPDTAIVTYGAVAQRTHAAPYAALMSSLYVRRPEGWKLAFHQQTPQQSPRRAPR